MTRFFYDCEFLDDGNVIDLISIGIVADDGTEYYAVNADMDTNRVFGDLWLKTNVWPKLPIQWNREHPTMYLDMTSSELKPKWVIANEVRDFIVRETGSGPTELWAHYAAYDHVALAQLWGPMIKMPSGVPRWTHDLMYLEESSGVRLPKKPDDMHNALADARWARDAYNHLTKGSKQ